MWTLEFWKAAAERALKSAAQAALLAVGAGSVNALSLDWTAVVGFSAGGAFLSICTSLASIPFGDKGTPSMVTSR